MADRGFANINELEVGARVREFAEGMNGAWIRRSRELLWSKVFYVMLDVFFVCLDAVYVYMLRSRMGGTLSGPYLGFLLLYVVVIVLLCHSQNLYRTVRERSTLDEVIAVAKAVFLATLLLAAFIYLSGMDTVSRLVIGFSGLLNAIVLTGWRLWKNEIIRQRIADGSGVRNALIVGIGSVGQALASYLAENRDLGYAVKGFLSDRNTDSRVLGSPLELGSIARAHFIDEVFVTIPLENELAESAVQQSRKQGLAINFVPDFFGSLGWSIPIAYVGKLPVMELYREPLPIAGMVVKRGMDVVLSALGLLLALPVMAVVALVVKFDTPGPVFYRSSRVGKKGRRFVCYKFRTMVANAAELKQELKHLNERQGPLFKICNDPRLTRTGKLLRKYSLDELPQLLNVLKGEMSLVGPRPPVPEECAEYRLECLRRLDVKPGLTGLWQVTARRLPSFETTLVLDLHYIENWSLWLDLKILLRTLPAVLSGSGE